MKWSFKLGEFRGIGVYIHATFLILLAFIVLSHWTAGHSLGQTLEGVGFILAIFACVVLHEFGHALMAAKFGIKTRDITLLPIGGVARLERIPEEPWKEFWVALAGPAVNVVIAGALFLWLQLTASFSPFEQLTVTAGPFLQRLMIVNVMLLVFNMLPAFPMDGGRVLRAWLATRMEYTRATNIAASVGQGMALLFGLLGFFVNPFLLFIAFFVWIGAAQEASMVQMKAALGGIPVRRAMITNFEILSPDDPLSRAIEQTLDGSQQDFPVVVEGHVVGILTRQDLLAGLTRNGPQAQVGSAMQREFETVDPSEMLETAFRRLQKCQCRTVVVTYSNQLVGLVTMENVGEWLAIQAALESSQLHRG